MLQEESNKINKSSINRNLNSTPTAIKRSVICMRTGQNSSEQKQHETRTRSHLNAIPSLSLAFSLKDLRIELVMLAIETSDVYNLAISKTKVLCFLWVPHM